MKASTVKKIVVWLAAVAVAAVLSVFWWRLWMYHGWPGAPGLLHLLAQPDGEGSYDATFAEMFALSFSAIATGCVFAFRRSERHRALAASLPAKKGPA